MKQTWQNAKLYRELSEPFATKNEASDSIAEFHVGVIELRKKCRLPDVFIIVAANVMKDDGEEGNVLATLGLGSSAEHEVMLLQAMTEIRRNREAQMAAAVGLQPEEPA